MHIEFLREFVTLAETLSFTEAAKKVFVAQPALSKHIAALERELGVPLFQRTRRHVELTEAGSALLEDARITVMTYERITQTARRYRSDAEGTLAIGYLRGIAEDAIPLCHKRFRELYPRVEAVYEPYSYSDLPEALLNGEIEVAIGVSFEGGGEALKPELARADLFLDRLCVVASSDHPLARRPAASVPASDLTNETILSYPASKPFTGRDGVVDFFRDAGVAVTYLDRFDSLERLPLQLVTEECIALLPAHLEPFFRAAHVGEFTFIPLEGASLIAFQMLWQRDNTFASTFVKLLWNASKANKSARRLVTRPAHRT